MKRTLPEKQALSPREAAYLYGFSEGTLANWRSQKIGPRFYKLNGKRVIYFLRDLDEWARREPVLTSDSVGAR